MYLVVLYSDFLFFSIKRKKIGDIENRLKLKNIIYSVSTIL